MDCCCCCLCIIQKCCILRVFFHKWFFCARCGVSLWWNYSWSNCFSSSLIGDNGQTRTYCICASVEGHVGLLLLRKLSANRCRPKSAIFSTIKTRSGWKYKDAWRCQNHFWQLKIDEASADLGAVDDHVFSLSGCHGKACRLQLMLKQCQAMRCIFEGLSAKPAAPVPY